MCGGWLYIIGAAGTLLSCDGAWWGICPSCKGDVHQQGTDFIEETLDCDVAIDGTSHDGQSFYNGR